MRRREKKKEAKERKKERSEGEKKRKNYGVDIKINEEYFGSFRWNKR